MDTWGQIIVAVLGSSGLMTFVTYLIGRHDKKSDKSIDIDKRITSLEVSDERIKAELRDIRKDVDFSHRVNHLNVKDRVKYLTETAVEQGYISVGALAYIEEGVKLLHEDGENGEMTACLEAVHGLKVGKPDE